MKKSQTQRAPQSKWIQVPQSLKLNVPFVRAIPLRPIGNDIVQYEAITDRGPLKIQIPNIASFQVSNGEIFDDMCNMDVLNQPQILNNLVARYKNDKIFTFIGPTLIAVNPYRVLPEYFSNQNMMRIRDKILSGTTNTQKPHIYLIAGNAYISMIDQQKKQAIVISGESGAGKTQSTKYCMQILTSLSHKQSLPIQAKILACNPLLEAFGNSKTTRNDNSSRFGKYVQIFFSGDNTIVGASINSYLLEKSRVVSAAQKQRNFHIFYCLIASGFSGLQTATNYNYLSRTKCYESNGINEKQYFNQIKKSMKSIGFSQKQENKIWQLLVSILELGNIQFDQTLHRQNQSKPCDVKNKKQMEKIAKSLGKTEEQLEKILLFQKKKFLKDITYSAYNRNKSIANVNTLSKAIYNSIFQFILYKIQKSLQPEKNKNFLSINILDIFGFENFDVNSFEQFCINFTNQKLLKLYNKYVFEKQMQILKEDGLYEQVASIKSPTNDAIIDIISGKLSLFSIINDNTSAQQFKDSDIIQSFENKLSKSALLKFQKIQKTKFTIVHSQCNVKYDIDGFKQKNQDKVLEDIANIVNNLFQHDSKQQVGKTILSKFSIEMDQLMNQLNSSCVHFIRCIKPNEKKIPNLTQEKYMITQIRYLGVFQTIQIRKKTFPSRWLYDEFLQRFQSLFPLSTGNSRTKVQKILKQLTNNPKDYLLGDKRVYMSPQLQSKLSKKLHQKMKKKIDAAKKIIKFYKNYKFKKQVQKRLKQLVKRIRIWKQIAQREAIKLQKYAFLIIKETADYKKEQQRILMNKKLAQAKQKRQEQQKKQKQLNKAKKDQNILKYCSSIVTIYILSTKTRVFTNLKAVNKSKNNPTAVSIPSKTEKNKNYEEESKNKSKNKFNYVSNMNDSMMNQSIIIDDNRGAYKREQTIKQQKKNYEFSQSFAQQKSILVTNDKNVLFQGTLSIPMYDSKQAKSLQKLKKILSEKYQVQYNQSQQDFFSPPSDDSSFQIQQTESQMMNKIINFDNKQFYKQVLRRRTNFFGMEKDQDDILVCKNKPLSKSLTLINQNDEKEAIRIFKSLLKISEEAKLQNVFKLIQVLIGLCHGTSAQLKNQIFLQLLKQSNSDLQLPSVRILQTLAVFLHIFNPDKNFLMAGLNFFFKKLAEQRYSQKQNEYVRYNFKKLLRKLQRPNNINYMPIKYQMMALMCKRKISLPIYLPIGSSVLIRVESYETFADIKIKVMQELGINHKRLIPQLFTFFQIVNFDNQQLEQSPISENVVVWDTITYWEKAKQKYKQKGILPPVFFLMLKIRYTFQCYYSDQEVVQIMFAQGYFQYFIGRLQFGLEDLAFLSACIKKLKYNNTPSQDYKASYPAWCLKKFQQNDMINSLKKNLMLLSKAQVSEYDIKFKFIERASKNPLCMCLVIGTDQNIKMYLKPKKILLTDRNQIVEQIPLKSITKFTEDGQKFVYTVRGASQTKIMYTEHAGIICNYLGMLPILVKISSENRKQANNGNILGDL